MRVIFSDYGESFICAIVSSLTCIQSNSVHFKSSKWYRTGIFDGTKTKMNLIIWGEEVFISSHLTIQTFVCTCCSKTKTSLPTQLSFHLYCSRKNKLVNNFVFSDSDSSRYIILYLGKFSLRGIVFVR